MSALFPIAKAAIAEWEKPRVLNEAFRVDHAFFERGDGHDNFESRTRRKLSLSRAVAERSQLIFDQRTPLFGLDAPRKNIGIESRRARQRENRAAVDVERDQRSLLALERFVSGFLHLPIYR